MVDCQNYWCSLFKIAYVRLINCLYSWSELFFFDFQNHACSLVKIVYIQLSKLLMFTGQYYLCSVVKIAYARWSKLLMFDCHNCLCTLSTLTLVNPYVAHTFITHLSRILKAWELRGRRDIFTEHWGLHLFYAPN